MRQQKIKVKAQGKESVKVNVFEHAFKGYQQVQKDAGKAALEVEKEKDAPRKAQEKILEKARQHLKLLTPFPVFYFLILY